MSQNSNLKGIKDSLTECLSSFKDLVTKFDTCIEQNVKPTAEQVSHLDMFRDKIANDSRLYAEGLRKMADTLEAIAGPVGGRKHPVILDPAAPKDGDDKGSGTKQEAHEPGGDAGEDGGTRVVAREPDGKNIGQVTGGDEPNEAKGEDAEEDAGQARDDDKEVEKGQGVIAVQPDGKKNGQGAGQARVTGGDEPNEAEGDADEDAGQARDDDEGVIALQPGGKKNIGQVTGEDEPNEADEDDKSKGEDEEDAKQAKNDGDKGDKVEKGQDDKHDDQQVKGSGGDDSNMHSKPEKGLSTKNIVTGSRPRGQKRKKDQEKKNDDTADMLTVIMQKFQELQKIVDDFKQNERVSNDQPAASPKKKKKRKMIKKTFSPPDKIAKGKAPWTRIVNEAYVTDKKDGTVHVVPSLKDKVEKMCQDKMGTGENHIGVVMWVKETTTASRRYAYFRIVIIEDDKIVAFGHSSKNFAVENVEVFGFFDPKANTLRADIGEAMKIEEFVQNREDQLDQERGMIHNFIDSVHCEYCK